MYGSYTSKLITEKSRWQKFPCNKFAVDKFKNCEFHRVYFCDRIIYCEFRRIYFRSGQNWNFILSLFYISLAVLIIQLLDRSSNTHIHTHTHTHTRTHSNTKDNEKFGKIKFRQTNFHFAAQGQSHIITRISTRKDFCPGEMFPSGFEVQSK